jgi:hypothetical protein
MAQQQTVKRKLTDTISEPRKSLHNRSNQSTGATNDGADESKLSKTGYRLRPFPLRLYDLIEFVPTRASTTIIFSNNPINYSSAMASKANPHIVSADMSISEHTLHHQEDKTFPTSIGCSIDLNSAEMNLNTVSDITVTENDGTTPSNSNYSSQIYPAPPNQSIVAAETMSSSSAPTNLPPFEPLVVWACDGKCFQINDPEALESVLSNFFLRKFSTVFLYKFV